MGTIQVEIGDVVAADSSFRRALTKAVERGDAHENCKKDAYATISLANIQVNADHKNQAASTATEIFRTVLEKEPANLYAANGIGVVYVDKGASTRLRQIFSQVREASAECIPAQRNLALLSVMQGARRRGRSSPSCSAAPPPVSRRTTATPATSHPPSSTWWRRASTSRAAA